MMTTATNSTAWTTHCGRENPLEQTPPGKAGHMPHNSHRKALPATARQFSADVECLTKQQQAPRGVRGDARLCSAEYSRLEFQRPAGQAWPDRAHWHYSVPQDSHVPDKNFRRRAQHSNRVHLLLTPPPRRGCQHPRAAWRGNPQRFLGANRVW